MFTYTCKTWIGDCQHIQLRLRYSHHIWKWQVISSDCLRYTHHILKWQCISGDYLIYFCGLIRYTTILFWVQSPSVGMTWILWNCRWCIASACYTCTFKICGNKKQYSLPSYSTFSPVHLPQQKYINTGLISYNTIKIHLALPQK